MPTSTRLRTLLEMLEATRAREIACDECLAQVAEYLEAEREEQPLSETLAAVRQHLAFCGECREEYETLLVAMDALDPG